MSCDIYTPVLLNLLKSLQKGDKMLPSKHTALKQRCFNVLRIDIGTTSFACLFGKLRVFSLFSQLIL